jgi:HK97 gp10 family phage protein
MAKEVEGLAQVVANLRALPAAIAGKNGGPIRVALAKAAKVIRDEARARVPVDDREGRVGKHLREQIVMKRDRNPQESGAAERYIVTVKYRDKKYANTARNRRAGKTGTTYQNFGDFYYWKFLEFGTSEIEATAFMRKSFESNKDSLADLVRDELAAGIAAAVRSMQK